MNKYFTFIDGLRGLSVILVFFFHIKILEKNIFLEGGFLGVDIFFVISGFVITHILLIDNLKLLDNKKVFFIRRFRRLIPALIIVLCLVLLISIFYTSLNGIERINQSAFANFFQLQNFLFFLQTGYFELNSNERPLIHTWSLAIEWQFYIFFPFILRILINNRKLFIFIIIILIFISEFLSRVDSNLNFYFTIPRIWELLLGSYIYTLENKELVFLKKIKIIFYPSLLASVLILLNANEFDRHPSIMTFIFFIPLIFILKEEILYKEKKFIYLFIDNRILTKLGKISYSFYLIHYPTLYFLRLHFNNLSVVESAAYSLLIILFVSVLFYHFVETKFRNTNIISDTKFFKIFIPLILVLVILTFSNQHYLNKKKLNLPEKIISEYEKEFPIQNCFDVKKSHLKINDWYCELNPKAGKAKFIVLGDSQAFSTLPGFLNFSKNKNINGIAITQSGCIPFLQIHLKNKKNKFDCYLHNKKVYEFIKDNGIKNIFLVSRWNYYTRFSKLIDLYNSKLFPSDENKRLKIFEAGFKKSINFLKNDKTNIYVLQQIPTASKYPYGQYLDLYSNEFNLKKRFLKLSTKEIDYIEETKEINEIFNKDKNYVNVLNTSNVFCDNNRCNIGTIDSIYYSDEYHLTYKGGEKIYDVISHLSFD